MVEVHSIDEVLVVSLNVLVFLHEFFGQGNIRVTFVKSLNDILLYKVNARQLIAETNPASPTIVRSGEQLDLSTAWTNSLDD